MSDSAYVLHLLRRVEQDVEFLQEQGALSYEDAALITTKLKEAEVLSLPPAAVAPAQDSAPAPSAGAGARGPAGAGAGVNGSRVADLSRQMSGMSVGEGSGGGRTGSGAGSALGRGRVEAEAEREAEVGIGKARAVWDYVEVQPDDLAFSKGDVIVILEESNADWWKGQLGELAVAVWQGCEGAVAVAES